MGSLTCAYRKSHPGLAQGQRCGSFAWMIDLFKLLGGWLVEPRSSSNLKRWSAGIEAASVFTGAGSRDVMSAGGPDRDS
jgi:hypothetical protein